MGWCDDPKSKNYNKLISLPCNFSHEKLYRKDNIYDLILVLNYNFKPIVKNKGSAIFIHILNFLSFSCLGKKRILKNFTKIRFKER